MTPLNSYADFLNGVKTGFYTVLCEKNDRKLVKLKISLTVPLFKNKLRRFVM